MLEGGSGAGPLLSGTTRIRLLRSLDHDKSKAVLERFRWVEHDMLSLRRRPLQLPGKRPAGRCCPPNTDPLFPIPAYERKARSTLDQMLVR